jgi:cytoskeletal protein RodZ
VVAGGGDTVKTLVDQLRKDIHQTVDVQRAEMRRRLVVSLFLSMVMVSALLLGAAWLVVAQAHQVPQPASDVKS